MNIGALEAWCSFVEYDVGEQMIQIDEIIGNFFATMDDLLVCDDGRAPGEAEVKAEKASRAGVGKGYRSKGVAKPAERSETFFTGLNTALLYSRSVDLSSSEDAEGLDARSWKGSDAISASSPPE